MPTAPLRIGPRRYLDLARDLVISIPRAPSPVARVYEAATEADRQAADHLTWWTSPAALAYRVGARIEHPTGLISRWSLTASTQGRYWIVLEVWSDRDAKTSTKQTLPRHLHPSLFARQLDGEVVETARRAA
jgi:hypothetical protein